jgi:hypothetical protein
VVTSDTRNARWKVLEAVDGLASSVEPLPLRLADAVAHVVVVRDDDFPNDHNIRQRWSELRKAMTQFPSIAGEGRIAATAAQMDDDEARRHIEALLRILCDLSAVAGPL